MSSALPSDHATSERHGPKRVALLLPSLAGGGAERVALAIARDLWDRGHQVDLLLLKREGELLGLVPDGVRVIAFEKTRLRQIIGPLKAYLRKERPHALQALMWPLTVYAVIAHRLARSGARLVLVDHDTLSKQYRTGLRSRALRWTLRHIYPLASARIAVSNGAADDMASLSGLPRRTIEVVANPIDLRERPATTVRQELWPTVGERILAVGSLVPKKRHELLIRAFAKLKAERPDARLTILGEGAERLPLEALVRALNLEDSVALPGFTIDPSAHFATADLFVMASDYEAFGLVLVEALNAGLRIVSTDCPVGPAEILDGGAFGTLVPVDDVDALAGAMKATLAKPNDAARQMARARSLAGIDSLRRYEQLMLG